MYTKAVRTKTAVYLSMALALSLIAVACENPIIADWYKDDRPRRDSEETAAEGAPAAVTVRTVDDLLLTYNVPAPYGGENPVTSFGGPQYTGTVDWTLSGGAPFDGSFVTGERYSASVTLRAVSERTFTGGVVWTPSVEAAEPAGFFKPDTVYSATVTLTPVLGYYFDPGATVSHTKGTAAIINNDEMNLVVTITFPSIGHIASLINPVSYDTVTIAWTGVPGYYYETHAFKNAGNFTLTLKDPSSASITADYLIVAGGGGSGGLLYRANQPLPWSGTSLAITVGAGGNGDAKNSFGPDGSPSSIGGSIVVAGGGAGNGGTANAVPGVTGQRGIVIMRILNPGYTEGNT